MIKIVLILALAAVVNACGNHSSTKKGFNIKRIEIISNLKLDVTAPDGGCISSCIPTKSLVCATDHLASNCHLLNACRLRAENCNRSILRQPFLATTLLKRCRNISKPNTSGPCARLERTCSDLKCLDPSRAKICYRSKTDNCRLLTNCEVQRLNCKRGPSNRVARVDQRHCAGLTGAQVARCKAIPRTCSEQPCTDPSRAKICYRSKTDNCRLLTNCELQRLNCKRGTSNRVARVDQRHCAGLTGAQVATCKAIPRTCSEQPCTDTSPTKICYRSKTDNCRLLTICEMQRLNCKRGPSNLVLRVDDRHCAGLTGAQIATCKAIPRTCSDQPCTDPSPTKICYRSNANDCRLLTICEMQRLNCERGPSNLVLRVDDRHCAGLTGAQVGTCKTIHTSCRDLRCTDPSPTKICYRGNANDCRLLTVCEMQRLNCEGGPSNQVRRVDQGHCAGLTAGHVATCKALTTG